MDFDFVLGCPPEFVQSGSSCLYLSDYTLDWDASRIKCEELGGRLAVIDTQQKQQDMEEYMAISPILQPARGRGIEVNRALIDLHPDSSALKGPCSRRSDISICRFQKNNISQNGVATQFPWSQFYPNLTVEFKFYHATLILILTRFYFILAQKLNFIHLSVPKTCIIISSIN